MLRCLAILVVVFFHYPRPEGHEAYHVFANFGWTGVELFFVLSGFLIGSQLLEPVSRGETPSLKRFYLRRSLRILPSFLVVLALYLFVPAWPERPVVTPAWRFLTFTQNFGLSINGFSHAWSLCVEEHFYLVLPLTVLALRGRLRAPSLIALAAAVMLGGMLLRGGLWMQSFSTLGPEEPGWRDYDRLLYYPTYARLDGLTCGVLLAALRVFRPEAWERWTRGARAGGMAFIGLACLGGVLFLNEEYYRNLPYTVVAFPLVSLGFAALVMALAGPSASRVCARIPGVKTFAVLSFTVYLTHKAMQHAVRDALKPHGMDAFHVVTVLGGVVAVLLASLALHQGVERPMLKLRERLERRLAPKKPLPQPAVS
ncbi:acyltransferase [Corallococcus exercitus]|uniref:Acyltransferase n=1 Tax=Corallococcus exercitus TaxID=2316736 RepID=A0A3A8IMD1_9BACT|nr:acyltransferase [Corallococcus exercitus]NOK35433.1 acyltransferase [Corallococcus exercitus]RKG78543.1 acyltransferase [Corallococcus exercitus]